MKPPIVILVIFLNFSCAFGQRVSPLFLNSDSKYYSSTDFSKVDSLKTWFYVLLDKNSSYEDPIQPIGQLIFQKDTTIQGWTPNFKFQIFNIKDSSYCFKKAQLVRALSSCAPPNVAGDIIIFNQFIFLNTNVRLQCKNFEDGLDYCRPIINKVFSAVDKTKVTTLEELVKQFPIKGKITKLPY